MSQSIYICRHGQTEWNRDRRLQGQLDSPLTAEGISQAQQLAAKATGWAVDCVVSSHLGRAQQTADICADTLAKPRAIYQGLCERHFGDWQGKHTDNLPAYQAFREHRYTRPDLMPDTGGESANMVSARFKQTLATMVESEAADAFLVISHGDAMACVAQTFGHTRKITNCSGFLLRWENNDLHWQQWVD